MGVPGGTASTGPAALAVDVALPRRVALVHDFLVDVRGAERTFEAACELWPEGDIFTAVYDEDGTEGRFTGRTVHASFLQRVRPTARNFRALLPLYPAAMERLDLSGYDLVVSSSSAWAHGVVPAAEAVHACYCHNPFRYAWDERDATLAARGPVTRPVLRNILDHWQDWDRRVSQRVDRYFANSDVTRARIRRHFDRDAAVIYPPVSTDRFSPGPVGDHHVLVSELVAHKRIDVAVRAFTQLGWPLVVIGDGPEGRRLQRMAGPSVTFAGRVSDARLCELVRSSRALVVTAVEEFGIAAVEAQAAGRPAIVPATGGGRETVIEGETGAFYDTGDWAALAAVAARFPAEHVQPRACVANAARFSAARFRHAFGEAVLATYAAFSPSPR